MVSFGTDGTIWYTQGACSENLPLDLYVSPRPCAEPCPQACLGDIDGDCTVGITDMLTLLANWG